MQVESVITSAFQSTLSVRRATICGIYAVPRLPISIHALREESDDSHGHEQFHLLISIHALREESDDVQRCDDLRGGISIHALREESDEGVHRWGTFLSGFQSTLSVRRATAQMDSMFHIVEHLSFVQVQE